MILTLDAALGPCAAGLVHPDGSVQELRLDAARGNLARLPLLAAELLAGRTARVLRAVAVTVGPGSFTGIRAALALAHGVGLAGGRPVLGVTIGAALAWGVPPGRPFWTAIDSRRGRVFLERNGTVRSYALDDLPEPDGPISLAGDAAAAVATRLIARGHTIVVVPATEPTPAGIAAASRHPLPPQPLYVDPPEARPSAG